MSQKKIVELLSEVRMIDLVWETLKYTETALVNGWEKDEAVRIVKEYKKGRALYTVEDIE